MKKRLGIMAFLLLIFFADSGAETIVPGGSVSGIWTAENSPYLIQGDIAIDSSSILAIDPGVEILFQGYYRLLCEGQLIAMGTLDDSIKFDGYLSYWDGIDFLDLNLNEMDSSRLSYCYITNSKSSREIEGIEFKHGGALFISNSDKILISNCIFSANQTKDIIGANAPNNTHLSPQPPGEEGISGDGGAIYCFNSDFLLQGNLFINNSTGLGKGGNGGAYIISYTTYYGKDGGIGGLGQSGHGGALYIEQSSVIIEGNRFIENSTGVAVGGTGGIGQEASSNQQQWNTHGGDGGDGGDTYSGYGGAVYIKDSDVFFRNNLFSSNKIGNVFGGTGGNGGAAYAGYWSIAYGGSGGEGGDAVSGEGAAIYKTGIGFVRLCNCTITENMNNGAALGGNGGIGGGAIGYGGSIPGSNGSPGEADSVQYVVANSGIIISNSIIYNNNPGEIFNGIVFNYSCLEELYPGTGNITQAPEFLVINGRYLLSQISAGQQTQSPCVNAGCVDSAIVSGTTRTDGIQDDGILDMGYHYPLFTPVIVKEGNDNSIEEFVLYEAYPNPFNYRITLNFYLQNAGEVKLAVYDVLGREIQDLGFGNWELGTHSVVWDAKDCGSGVYFVKLQQGEETAVQKVVLMK